MKIKKRKEMRKRSYTPESKTELFFWLFLAKIIFLFLLRNVLRSRRVAKRDGKLADGSIEQIEVCMK